MLEFTIETTYRLPVYRQRSVKADTLEAACAAAVANDDWDDGTYDFESSGLTYVTGAWEGEDAAYEGNSLDVPSQFHESVQRTAACCHVLLDRLRAIAREATTEPHSAPPWLERLGAAIAEAETIIAFETGPGITGRPP